MPMQRARRFPVMPTERREAAGSTVAGTPMAGAAWGRIQFLRPGVLDSKFPSKLRPRSPVPVNGVTFCPTIRCATLSMVGASLLKPPCVREVLADGPVRSFETDQITSPATAPLLSSCLLYTSDAADD